jgi:hypothetical protein
MPDSVEQPCNGDRCTARAVGSKPRWWRRQRRVKSTARLAATESTESKKFKEKLLGGASTVLPGHKRAQCRDPTRCWNGHIATGCPQGQAPKRGRLQPPHSSSLRRTAARAYSPHHLPNHFPELPHSTPVSRSGAWEGATTERSLGNASEGSFRSAVRVVGLQERFIE